MARILLGGEWYDELSPDVFYEAQFENIVVNNSELLYPGYHVVPFKLMVYSDLDAAKADLALLDRKYREWWVVEIEMGYHSLGRHVLPQVITLSQATYGRREAEYLCRRDSRLDLGSVQEMMKGSQPQVLVVVNSIKPDWAKSLAPYGAVVVTLEVFRSESGTYAFRSIGEPPKRRDGLTSRCTFDPVLRRFLVVESPAVLGIAPHEKVRIRYEDKVTEWARIDAQDKVWLQPLAAIPLTGKKKYELIRLEDGSLELRPET